MIHNTSENPLFFAREEFKDDSLSEYSTDIKSSGVGEKISEGAVSIMNKLDIKPFSVGFIPLAAFDTKEKKLYDSIIIDREGVLNELKNSFSKALAFAVEMGYFAEETIKLMIGKAGREETSSRYNSQISSEDWDIRTDKLKDTHAHRGCFLV